MTPTLRHKVLVVLAALAAMVGIIDTAMAGQWDLVAVFALVLVPMLGLLAALEWGRQVVPLRRDLATGLRDRSAMTGEPLSTVADRAVAAQRAALGEASSADEEPVTTRPAAQERRSDPP